MFIEFRDDFETKAYLVNSESSDRGGWNWTDFSQPGTKEYGNGNKLFLFEGMGAAYQPFALDLIHANSKEDAEILIQERYGVRFQYKTLIRKHEEVIEVIDER